MLLLRYPIVGRNLAPNAVNRARTWRQKTARSPFVEKKCARQDLNLHVFRHQILSLARLPIPPLALVLIMPDTLTRAFACISYTLAAISLATLETSTRDDVRRLDLP